MALVTRQGSGALLTQSQGDVNWDTLNGINEAQTGTSHTIDHTDELKTIEYSNANSIAVTLTAIATIAGANDSQISDFKVTLKNVGAGLVTVSRSSTNTFDGGATSITIPQYHSVTIQTDSSGGIWNIVSKGDNKTYTSTDDKIDNFPTGTAMLFYQAAAPTGWTGSDTLTDHAIQIVSTTGGTAGAAAGTSGFSTVFGKTATDAHTLSVGETPSHTHGILAGSGTISGVSNGTPLMGATVNNGERSGQVYSTGGGGSHTHDIELRVKHAQVIIAIKD